MPARRVIREGGIGTVRGRIVGRRRELAWPAFFNSL
jgi:hypothetical protein